MKMIYPQDSGLSPVYQTLFQQGAGAIAEDGVTCAGLWFENTPEYEGVKVGTIGGCMIDESASLFISECTSFLHEEHGLKTIVGPMNGNTWLQHRLIQESGQRDPFLMEPYEPDYFLDVFQDAGFEVLSRYVSSSVDLDGELQELDKLTRRFEKSGVRLRSIDMDDFERDLEQIYELSILCFSNNFLYTPISKELFMGKYLSSKDHIDPDMVLLAECENDLVGFVFCMPDLLAVQQDKPPALIVKTLAVKAERRFFGLGSLLVDRAHTLASAKGYTEAIHALQHDGNSSQRISKRFKAEVFRRYALMVKFF